MKKLVLLSLAATVITGSAFAASVPVTKISDNSTKVQADYAFNQRVSNSGGTNNDGFGVSLEHDLSNKSALQYSFNKVNAKNGDIKVHPNINLYGAGTAIRTHDTNLGVQAGVIGHVPLTDKVNGYAKAGWGNDIKQSYQVGAQYEVKPNIDLNVYYGYDKYSVNDNDKTSKGLHAGVGYTF